MTFQYHKKCQWNVYIVKMKNGLNHSESSVQVFPVQIGCMEFKVEDAAVLVAELEEKTGLIGLLRQVSPSSGDFDELYVAPITGLADHVQRLPACAEHHGDPGGLLRHAVQSAYFALRLSDGAVFGANLPAEERRVVDRDSRRAAFLAALVSPV
ncbi:MAG: TraI domain-containing protein, partial [Georgfuchsia sp.]